jgi:UDP-N-acetylenolpyruvoylglucosamine reductase
LVNYGGANGNDILNLANEIIEVVYKTFGIKIINEVNFI